MHVPGDSYRLAKGDGRHHASVVDTVAFSKLSVVAFANFEAGNLVDD